MVSTDTIPISKGGTGETTANAALAALGGISDPTTTRGDIITKGASALDRLPIGAVNTFLKSDGTDPTWAALSVDLTSDVTGTLPLANGGTGASTSGDARSNLGAAASGANTDITSLGGITDLAVSDEMGYTVTTANLPASRPSLNLNFANAGVLDPRITFTRASTATYYDNTGTLQTAASGEARFDHDPLTGESLGFLIEEQRTNLLTYSEDFADATWIKTNLSATSNIVVAPDGTLTGDKLVENTATNVYHVFTKSCATSGSAGDTYQLSVYAKAAGRDRIILQVDAGNFGIGNCSFNLSTGLPGTPNGSASSPKMVAVGNGWYRCSLTVTSTGSFADINLKAILENASAQQQYTGDGVSGIYAWGAQIEAGAFPTSYIATTTAVATRAADVAVMTGTNFSEWFNPSAGTLFTNGASNPLQSTDKSIGTFSDNTLANRMAISTGAANAVWNPFIITNNVSQGSSNVGLSAPPTTSSKLAVAYAFNDFIASSSGLLSSNDTSVILPVVDRLYIGASANGTDFWNSHIRSLAYYPTRLTNAQLQALTEA